MARVLASRISGAIAIVLSLATSAFIIILAILLTVRHQKLYILALSGAIVQALVVCTLSHLFVRYCLKQSRNISRHGIERGERRTLVFALGIMPSAVAGSVVGATLGWSQASVGLQPRVILGQKGRTFVIVSLIVWVSSVVAQIVFCSFLFWASGSNPLRQRSDSTEEVQIVPEMMEHIRRSSSLAQPSPVYEQPRSTSAPPSMIGSDGASSRRSSFSVIQRPTNSKTRLLIRQHSFPRQSSRFFDHPAPSQCTQEASFDSWDTSGVAPAIRETVLKSSPATKGKILEPIPGSRSPSPAKALEGPFFPQPESTSTPPSPLPQPSYFRPESREQAAFGEDHIHPLFRTSSPNPPPTASSNTVVTAAPGAGQLINDRILKRMRSGSLPTTPTALARSNSFDTLGRPGSSIPACQDTPPVPEVPPSAVAVVDTTGSGEHAVNGSALET